MSEQLRAIVGSKWAIYKTSVYFQFGSQEAGLVKYDKYTCKNEFLKIFFHISAVVARGEKRPGEGECPTPGMIRTSVS